MKIANMAQASQEAVAHGVTKGSFSKFVVVAAAGCVRACCSWTRVFGYVRRRSGLYRKRFGRGGYESEHFPKIPAHSHHKQESHGGLTRPSNAF